MIKEKERLLRSRIFYFVFNSCLFAFVIYLAITLQALILPLLVGLISAYIATPALNYLIRLGLPKWLAASVLFVAFALAILFVGQKALNLIPNEFEQIKLQVQIRHEVNEHYTAYKVNANSANGNFIQKEMVEQAAPFIESMDKHLRLSLNEQIKFEQMAAGMIPGVSVEPEIVSYYRQYNQQSGKNSVIKSDKKVQIAEAPASEGSSFLHILSTWFVMPIVFIFVLLDSAKIKHFFIKQVPNKYFEMTLTTLANVDQAIGNYLRGTLSQCTLVGTSLFIGLMLLGFGIQASLLIGFIAGMANAIPYLGPLIGLAAGLLYAIIIPDLNPILPFVSSANIFLAVILTVAAVQLLDAVLYGPLVLGRAVNLHPLIVVFGVLAGSIIFGFVGMLLAVPAIVIVNVTVSTVYKELKAYYLIY